MSDKFQLAVEKVIDRLLQMRQLWQDAADNYFDPSRFILSLQGCITTSRTVSFILQANKADIPNFQAWYQLHVERWSADPIMNWAKEARNAIEKQGDLEGSSEFRAEIIASYMPGPETDWLKLDFFASPDQIWRSIPSKFFISHVIENGTLSIERRWVDSRLPNIEVLEALARVYDNLCLTISDLLSRNGIKPPPTLDLTRPDPMGELAMNRAIYLSMKDGSIRGSRYLKQPLNLPTEDEKRKLLKRYGVGASWSRLATSKTLTEVARVYFDNARVVTRRDDYHRSLTFFLRDYQLREIVNSEHPDRASRYILMRDLPILARIARANAVIMIGEVWQASAKDIPGSGFAVDAPNRGEALTLTAISSSGEFFQLSSKIIRRRPDAKKIKEMGPIKLDTDGFPFMLLPFMRQWDCLDAEVLRQAFKRMDELGIESPII